MAEETAKEQAERSSYVSGNMFLYGSAYHGAITIGVIWCTVSLIAIMGFLSHFSFVGLILTGILAAVSYHLARTKYDDYLAWYRRTHLRERYKEMPWPPLRVIAVLAGTAVAGMITAALLTPGTEEARVYAILTTGFVSTTPLAALGMYCGFHVRTPRLTCPRCGTNIDTDRPWLCMTCRPWTENAGGLFNSFLGECFKCLNPPQYIECPAPECHALVLLDNPGETIVKPEDTRRLHRCRLVLKVGEAETPEQEDLREAQELRTRHETVQEIKNEEERMQGIQQDVRVHESEEAADLRQKQEERAKAEKYHEARKEEQAIYELKQNIREDNRHESKSLADQLEKSLEKYLDHQMGLDEAVARGIQSINEREDLSSEMKEVYKEKVERWKEEQLRKQMEKGK